jgi:hypothetical protein
LKTFDKKGLLQAAFKWLADNAASCMMYQPNSMLPWPELQHNDHLQTVCMDSMARLCKKQRLPSDNVQVALPSCLRHEAIIDLTFYFKDLTLQP